MGIKITNKPLLTVFTPTYNRAYILPLCYESLKRQTNKDFIWLIVDDGSTDNTKKVIDGWKGNNDDFHIEYIYQLNKGKQSAHNTGVLACTTELFICVDSDDYLTDNAVAVIFKNWEQLKDKELVSGMVAMRYTKDNKPIGTELPANIKFSTLTDLYEKYHFKGDTALIYKSSILKEYLFELVDGEKFMGEDYIYIQIDQKYKLYVINQGIYICEYLNDGYTKNVNRLIINNPINYLRLKGLSIKLSKSILFKFKHAICYDSICFFLSPKLILVNSPNILLTLLAVVPGYLLYLKRFKNK